MSMSFLALPTMDVGTDPCDLRVIGLTKQYDGFALDAVSLGVPRGSVVGLIGQNGAGKTTIMKAVLGTVHADGGSVELFGRDVAGLAEADLVALRSQMAFVSATTAFPSVMTVSEVAAMYRLAYSTFNQAAFERLTARIGLLPQNAAKQVKDLSRGMGMKLQMACALASGARLMVMDEPTAGLDPIVRDEILDILREWMEDETRSVLISSHITTDLERLADYLVLIDDGRVVMACERNAMECMGVAHLRTTELERVREEAGPGGVRVLRHDLSWDLLVPNRVAFARAYPDYVCDRASIDDVMVLLVRGEVR